MRVLLVLLALTVCWTSSQSQPVTALRCLESNDELPKDLLSSKVMVLVSMAEHDSISPEHGEFEGYIKNAHLYFSKIGIEVTGYYNVEELFASPDMSQTYFKKVSPRNIDYICLLSHEHLASGELETLRLTKFNKKSSFISHGQVAYSIRNTDFYQLMVTLAKAVKASGQSSSNFLIEERANIVSGLPVLSGDKSYTYNSDLKVSKLAVRKFEPLKLPENLPPGNEMVKGKIEDYNAKVPTLNARLKRIMSSYPYPYEIVDNTTAERALFDQGYQFMLKSITSRERLIRKMLKMNPSKTKMVDASIESDDIVTKFYTKQLFSKYLYIGDKWDIATDWEVALQNYIDNQVQSTGQ